jgi:hypothetical protein
MIVVATPIAAQKSELRPIRFDSTTNFELVNAWVLTVDYKGRSALKVVSFDR